MIDHLATEFGHRGLETALARLDTVDFLDVPLCVSEILHWAYALQVLYTDHLGSVERYQTAQRADLDGRVVYGLMKARHWVVHALQTPSELTDSAFDPRVFQVDAFQVGRWHWVPLTGDTPDVGTPRDHYRRFVATQPVREPLAHLQPWYDTAATCWG